VQEIEALTYEWVTQVTLTVTAMLSKILVLPALDVHLQKQDSKPNLRILFLKQFHKVRLLVLFLKINIGKHSKVRL
jgi:hypothetical protein